MNNKRSGREMDSGVTNRRVGASATRDDETELTVDPLSDDETAELLHKDAPSKASKALYKKYKIGVGFLCVCFIVETWIIIALSITPKMPPTPVQDTVSQVDVSEAVPAHYTK